MSEVNDIVIQKMIDDAISRPWPHKNVTVDTVYFSPGHYGLRVYDRDLAELKDQARQDTLIHLLYIKKYLSKFGINIMVERMP